MTLLDVLEGEVAEIRALDGGEAVAARLHAMGLFAGGKIRLIRTAPFSGPLLIEEAISGGRFMLAREMAANIKVKSGRAPVR